MSFRLTKNKNGCLYFHSTTDRVNISLLVEKNAVWVLNLRVDEEFRGRGFGKAAMQEVIDLANGMAMPVLLYALADYPSKQSSLMRFYRQLGFRRFGPARCRQTCGQLMKRDSLPLASDYRYDLATSK